jgi:hypothetical protein
VILRDFHCDACSSTFEELVSSKQTAVLCACGSEAVFVLSAPRIGVYNDPGKRSAILKQRSQEHTVKELKKEPERYGFAAGEKRPWNLRASKAE